MDKLNVVLSTVNIVKDKFLTCKIGRVYSVEYTNIENNYKKREFIGLCIRKVKKGGETFIILRNIVGDVGVEFMLGGKAPSVIRLVETRMFKGVYRKAKLYYLRSKAITANRVYYK